MNKLKVWFKSFCIALFIGLLILLPTLFWVDSFEMDDMFKGLAIEVLLGTPIIWFSLRKFKD